MVSHSQMIKNVRFRSIVFDSAVGFTLADDQETSDIVYLIVFDSAVDSTLAVDFTLAFDVTCEERIVADVIGVS